MRFFSFVPLALALVACGAPPSSDPSPTGTTQEGLSIIIPPTPCPSSWCPPVTDCQTAWTCEQPFLAGPGQFTCTPTNAPVGTQCQNAAACISSGACDSTATCQPREPTDRYLCATTATGAHDGYICGACENYECVAEFENGIVYPAPATMCTVIQATY